VSSFRSIDEKTAGENEVCVLKSVIFCSVREIHHPSNISMNRTVEQLA